MELNLVVRPGKGTRHREAVLRGWCSSREGRSWEELGKRQRPGDQRSGCVKHRLQGSCTRGLVVGSGPGKQQCGRVADLAAPYRVPEPKLRVSLDSLPSPEEGVFESDVRTVEAGGVFEDGVSGMG